MSWILACDDHPHITRLVELTLQKAGWDVTCCSDGAAAWQLLQQASPPALIITDYQMPQLDGLVLIRQLRQQPLLAHIPVILLTAKGFELSEATLKRSLQIEQILVKPFSPRLLRKTVSELLAPTFSASERLITTA